MKQQAVVVFTAVQQYVKELCKNSTIPTLIFVEPIKLVRSKRLKQLGRHVLDLRTITVLKHR